MNKYKRASDVEAYFLCIAAGLDKETAKAISKNQTWLFVKKDKPKKIA